jgi:Kef-type K+ transport system membrane component KefB
MHVDLLADIGRCILVSMVLAYAAHLTRQPLILAYLAAGMLLGKNMGFGWLGDVHSIETIAEIGLILLLFMIGLEMDLKKVREAGRTVTLTGVVQVVVCAAIGWPFFQWLGGGGGEFDALYLAVCSALSSTLIVVKLLHDKLELDTLPGRITLGVLVLQDVAAILFLAVQPNLKEPHLLPVVWSFAKGIGLVAATFAATRFVLPPLFRSMAKVPELILAGSLAWCFLLVAAADMAGLSRSMGALIGGVSISTFPYNPDVMSKLTSLRDFFVTLFFVALGAEIPQPTPQLLAAAIGCTIFIQVSRYLSVTPLLLALRRGHRVSLIPAINLANVSEFSIVIAAMGLKSGHISADAQTLIIITFALSATLTTYKITYNYQLQQFISGLLKRCGLRDLDQAEQVAAEERPRLMLLGFAKVASSLLEEIERHAPALKEEIGVVDFNPETVHELRQRGIHVHYGDISHADSLRHAGIEHAEIILSSIPDHYLRGINNLRMVQMLRRLNPNAAIIATAETLKDARALYAAGATYASVPRLEVADDLLKVLEQIRAGLSDDARRQLQDTVIQRHEVIP